jgi:hypothetical protein
MPDKIGQDHLEPDVVLTDLLFGECRERARLPVEFVEAFGNITVIERKFVRLVTVAIFGRKGIEVNGLSLFRRIFSDRVHYGRVALSDARVKPADPGQSCSIPEGIHDPGIEKGIDRMYFNVDLAAVHIFADGFKDDTSSLVFPDVIGMPAVCLFNKPLDGGCSRGNLVPILSWHDSLKIRQSGLTLKDIHLIDRL